MPEKISVATPQLITDLSPIDASDQTTQVESDVLVPTYDAGSQLHTKNLDVLYPEWGTDHPTAVEDPELLLFDYVRTQEERRIGALQGLPKDTGEGVEKAIDQIPDDVGKRFQAHGIAGKSGSSSTEMDILLKKGIDPDRTLYTTELRYSPEAGAAIGADRPFTEGGLVVVGKKDEYIRKTEDISYVIVGEQYLPCFDAMQERFKGVQLIPWHDAPQFFCDLVNAEGGTAHAPEPMDYARSYEIGRNDDLPGSSAEAGSVAMSGARVVINLDDIDWDGDDVW